MYWNEPVAAINDASPTNLIPPAETKMFPPTFDRVVFGSPIISDAILIEPDDTNIPLNGLNSVPNVAPLASFGTMFPPNSVVPFTNREPVIVWSPLNKFEPVVANDALSIENPEVPDVPSVPLVPFIPDVPSVPLVPLIP